MAQTSDAVVIGGGHHGLVAANLLADAGWSVVVLEQRDRLGGAVATTEIAPGFHADLYSAFYPLGFASPALRRLHLEDHGLRWSRAPAVLAHVFPDGRAAVIESDLHATAAGLDEWHQGDGSRWIEEAAFWRSVRPGVLASLLSPFPPVRSGLRLARSTRLAGLARLSRLALSSARDYTEETWSGEGARTLITGNAMHSDVSPEGAGSALIGWLLSMLGQDVGFPVPMSGAAALTDALVRRLRQHGGETRTGERVVSVDVTAGRASGVHLASGEQVRARRAVIADVSAPHLYRDLLPSGSLPARFGQALDRFRWDPPTIKVNWALDGPIPWRDPRAGRAGTVHFGGTRDELSQTALDLNRGRRPSSLFVLLGQMTTSDPSRSPEGTEVAWAYTHLPAGPVGDPAETVQRIEATLEELAPGFGALIRARLLQQPGSGEFDLGPGAVNGGTAMLSQQLVFRPVPGLGRAETPIDGLYLGSASAHPGGGVHGACGANAALAAVSRERISGPMRRRLIDGVWRGLYP